jgi:alpha-N-acetylglucosaminidase
MKIIFLYITILIFGFNMFQSSILADNNIKKSAPDIIQPAKEVLKRILGTKADKFILDILDVKADNDVFEVEARDGKVFVKGNSTIALTRGVYHYLRYATSSMLTWSGKNLDLTGNLPDFPKTKISTPYKYRLYYNVCTYGYTTAFWDWDQWEKELDWMALHGINMPLAMIGQESIWKMVWKEMGITDEELNNYFTGPAFLPWHRMGNVNKHDGPVPVSFFEKSKNLQKKIINRMMELGMVPVVPAFSGYVPKSITRVYPDAEMIKMAPWVGFPEENGTFLLSPLSKYFPEIGKKFIEKYRKEYGDVHFYLADAFNEMKVPVSENGRYKELRDFGRAIFNSINAGDSLGTWVMQGWLFHNDSHFWDKPSTQALLKDVPDDRMIIIDLANEQFTGWKNHDAFYGKQWIYSIIHDFGGHNQLFGNLPFYSTDPAEMLASSNHGKISGFGISPEGINQNEIVYELLTDMEWTDKPADIKQWLGDYCKARYGKFTERMKESWDLLLNSIYSNTLSAPVNLFQLRPGLKPNPNDLYFDNFDKAVKLFLSCAEDYKNKELYLHDLIQLTIQQVSIKTDFLLEKAIYWHQQKNYNKRNLIFNEAFELLKEMDALLNTEPSLRLERWIDFASKWGDKPEEIQYYKSDAIRQITTWGGPFLTEYAAKVWSGLIRDYYLPRWEYFFQYLKDGKEYKIHDWEENWIKNTSRLSMPVKIDDPVLFAENLLKKADSYVEKYAGHCEIKARPIDNNQVEITLLTKSNDLAIYYSIDGKAPSDHSLKYSKEFIVKPPCVLKAVAYKNGKKFGDEASMKFSLSYHANINLVNPPDKRYPGEALTLVDGIKGSMLHKDGKWLGYDGEDMTAVLDLKRECNIHSVTINFLENQSSWIFFPAGFEVFISEDGKDFQPAGKNMNNIPKQTDDNATKEISVQIPNKKARFIKVFVKNTAVCPKWHVGAGKKTWMFMDEIIVE